MFEIRTPIFTYNNVLSIPTDYVHGDQTIFPIVNINQTLTLVRNVSFTNYLNEHTFFCFFTF